MGINLYRSELPRVYELYDLVPSPPPSGAYFGDFERTLGEWTSKRKFFADIERDLDGLDNGAWAALKKEIAPRLTVKDAKRGWQPLFDILNHAKAYNYLKQKGCTNIRFIPISHVQGKRTPRS